MDKDNKDNTDSMVAGMIINWHARNRLHYFLMCEFLYESNGKDWKEWFHWEQKINRIVKDDLQW